jgi:hypothetical protein
MTLAAVVRPEGDFAFSAHSSELFAQLDPARFADPKSRAAEFLFWEANETAGRIATADYGCSIVKESFVRRTVREVPGMDVVARFGMGVFDRYHDIYVAHRAGNPD